MSNAAVYRHVLILLTLLDYRGQFMILPSPLQDALHSNMPKFTTIVSTDRFLKLFVWIN